MTLIHLNGTQGTPSRGQEAATPHGPPSVYVFASELKEPTELGLLPGMHFVGKTFF